MTLSSGIVATASAPSGASTGKAEAIELRDGDRRRYRGLGCRKAVSSIAGEIAGAICGKEIADQRQLDQAMIDLDGTNGKARLGGNAILAVSLTFARACSAERRVPLYQHFADMLGQPLRTLPRLTVNLFSGGKHAGGQVPIQDVLVVPVSAKSIDDSLASVYAAYQCAAELSQRKYGMRALTADEGGLAPPFASAEAMLDDAVQSIRDAGLAPGNDIAIAVDVASSHFYQDGQYHIANQQPLGALSMIDKLRSWLDDYPIVSIEDGLSEDDWDNWPKLRSTIGDRALVLGDDLLCTNPQRIQKAIDTRSANALLLKVNQIGTLSEAADACRLARSAGWAVTISARSGETEDNWLADLSVGWSGDQIKVGSITQSERLAKYNRLLAIERESKLPIVKWPN